MGRARGERREHQFGPRDYLNYVHGLPCSIRGCNRRPIEAAHATSRGAGGSYRDLLPLCWRHHREQHAIGILTFQKRHNINLAREAARTLAEWEGDFWF